MSANSLSYFDKAHCTPCSSSGTATTGYHTMYEAVTSSNAQWQSWNNHTQLRPKFPSQQTDETPLGYPSNVVDADPRPDPKYTYRSSIDTDIPASLPIMIDGNTTASVSQGPVDYDTLLDVCHNGQVMHLNLCIGKAIENYTLDQLESAYQLGSVTIGRSEHSTSRSMNELQIVSMDDAKSEGLFPNLGTRFTLSHWMVRESISSHGLSDCDRYRKRTRYLEKKRKKRNKPREAIDSTVPNTVARKLYEIDEIVPQVDYPSTFASCYYDGKDILTEITNSLKKNYSVADLKFFRNQGSRTVTINDRPVVVRAVDIVAEENLTFKDIYHRDPEKRETSNILVSQCLEEAITNHDKPGKRQFRRRKRYKESTNTSDEDAQIVDSEYTTNDATSYTPGSDPRPEALDLTTASLDYVQSMDDQSIETDRAELTSLSRVRSRREADPFFVRGYSRNIKDLLDL
ncbi:uncharacterized protein IL334_003062 [Kwoniella shivajii]|uniref:Grh/CP2 DB domain-containing protein n=1 Tax=Kwoniella shivajii TaxID=564305 RepID=A0ABZ1CY91_9TREE|nr:hypothetical protein IL334_003062 [Kwoniella shivajii]